jgi:hypothetical protein
MVSVVLRLPFSQKFPIFRNNQFMSVIYLAVQNEIGEEVFQKSLLGIKPWLVVASGSGRAAVGFFNSVVCWQT